MGKDGVSERQLSDVWKEGQQRRETLAVKEGSLLYWSLGLELKETPVKVVNPDDNDLNRIARNLGVKSKLGGKLLGQMIKYEAGGLADPADNRIYDFNHTGYSPGIYGVDWSEALSDVTPVSLHEAGHAWVFQNGIEILRMYDKKLKLLEMGKRSEVGEVESAVCVKIISEGVAMYIAKRSNDFIRDNMIMAVDGSFPGDSVKRERCASEYSARYDSRINSGQYEEDFALTQEVVQHYQSGVVEKFKNRELLADFMSNIVYRLGYSLVDHEIQRQIKNGLTEAQALTELVESPPLSMNEIGKVLGLIDSGKID